MMTLAQPHAGTCLASAAVCCGSCCAVRQAAAAELQGLGEVGRACVLRQVSFRGMQTGRCRRDCKLLHQDIHTSHRALIAQASMFSTLLKQLVSSAFRASAG